MSIRRFTDIHGPQTMNPTAFDDPLTFQQQSRKAEKLPINAILESSDIIPRWLPPTPA